MADLRELCIDGNCLDVPDRSNYYTKTQTDNRFYTRSQMDVILGNYETAADVAELLSNDFYTKSQCNTRYYQKATIDSTFVTQAHFDSNVGSMVDLFGGHTDLVSAVNDVYLHSFWKAQATGTKALYHCSGTATGNIYYHLREDEDAVYLFGRVYITGFSRSGANPGITVSELNFGHGSGHQIGFVGEDPRETVSLDPSTGRITASETFGNRAGTQLTLMISPTFIFI